MLRRHEASFFRGSLATPSSRTSWAFFGKAGLLLRLSGSGFKLATRGPFGGCLRPQMHTSGQNSASKCSVVSESIEAGLKIALQVGSS